MYEVTVTAWFAAAHRLRLPAGQLEPLHGHNWNVRVTCRGDAIDASGMLVDFTLLRPALQTIVGELHDTLLNDHPFFADCNPSAEHVARFIAARLGPTVTAPASLHCVEVEEEPGCFARYFPADATG